MARIIARAGGAGEGERGGRGNRGEDGIKPSLPEAARVRWIARPRSSLRRARVAARENARRRPPPYLPHLPSVLRPVVFRTCSPCRIRGTLGALSMTRRSAKFVGRSSRNGAISRKLKRPGSTGRKWVEGEEGGGGGGSRLGIL